MTFNLTPSSAPFSGMCWNRSWWPRRTNPASSQIVTLSTLTLLSLMNQYSWPLMTRMLLLLSFVCFLYSSCFKLFSFSHTVYRHLWCIRASIMAKYFQKMTNRKKHWYEFFTCISVFDLIFFVVNWEKGHYFEHEGGYFKWRLEALYWTLDLIVNIFCIFFL